MAKQSTTTETTPTTETTTAVETTLATETTTPETTTVEETPVVETKLPTTKPITKVSEYQQGVDAVVSKLEQIVMTHSNAGYYDVLNNIVSEIKSTNF